MSPMKISAVAGIFVHVLFILNRNLLEHILLCYNSIEEKR